MTELSTGSTGVASNCIAIVVSSLSCLLMHSNADGACLLPASTQTAAQASPGASNVWRTPSDLFEGLQAEHRAKFPGDPPEKNVDSAALDRHIASLREFIKPINARASQDVTWTVKITSAEQPVAGSGKFLISLTPVENGKPWIIQIDGSESDFSEVLVRGTPIGGEVTLSASVDFSLSVDTSRRSAGKKPLPMLIAPYLVCKPKLTLKSIVPAKAMAAGPEMGLAKALVRQIRSCDWLDTDVCCVALQLDPCPVDFRTTFPVWAELIPRAKRLGELRRHPALVGKPPKEQDELLAKAQVEVVREQSLLFAQQIEKFWTGAHNLNGQGPATIAGQTPQLPRGLLRSTDEVKRKLDEL